MTFTIFYRTRMIIVMLFLVMPAAFAHDNGQFAGSPLHDWFNGLASHKGLCCSFADGRTINDPDVDMSGLHYKVRIDGEWIEVPDNAVITEPNRFGQAVVWPFKAYITAEDGAVTTKTEIRCFLPGAGI